MRKIIFVSVSIIAIAFIVGVVIFNKKYIAKQNVAEKSQISRTDTDKKEKGKVHMAYLDTNWHVIYDGKDMGEGDNIKISGNHVGFTREINGKFHFIYDGNDLGEIGDKNINSRIAWDYFDISGNNYAFDRIVENKNHAFYNGRDLGESECFKISGNDYAIARKTKNAYQLTYNGEDMGNLYDQAGGFGSICYSFIIKDKNIFYLNPALNLFKNKNKIGQTDWDIFRGYEGGYATVGISNFSASAENYCFSDMNNHVIFNGKDLGYGHDCRVSGNNIAYSNLNGNKHVIYNGKDIGEGYDIILKDSSIAFMRGVKDIKAHVIFNGEDMGEGYLQTDLSGMNENNIISGNNIVFLRKNLDHTTDVIYNGKNLGQGYVATIVGNSLAYIKIERSALELIFDNSIVTNNKLVVL